VKNFTLDVNDSTNLGFVVSQTAHIEAGLVARKYPGITYQADIPVDTSAHPFAKSITFFSSDNVGAAKIINGHGDDIPMANVDLGKSDAPVHMGGIGYSFSLEEIGQAQMIGMGLDAMGAASARFAYEKFVDAAAYSGTGLPGGTGLYNSAAVTPVASTGLFSALTPDQVLLNLNTLIGGAFSSTLGIEMVNTVRLPLAVFTDLTTRRVTDINMTIMQFLREANVYTAQTGQPLDIKADYRLTTRAVAWMKDPEVLKLHIPMTLRFLPVQPRNVEYYVPGMFRMAGLDIRRPGAVRYLDGVAA
jgi:hypothetical protein